MEIRYKTIVKRTTTGTEDFQTYKSFTPDKNCLTNDSDYCCDDIEYFWKYRKIALSEYNYHNVEKPPVVLRLLENNGYAGEDDQQTNEYPIKFCPFCGEKFTVKEVEKVRATQVEKEVTETRKITEWKEEKI